MKKVIFVFILFAINYFNAQVNTLESSLVLQNGLYYQNNAPFTGNALSYYPQEQIKSICEIKEGQKTGSFTSYYYDNSFNKVNFKDTTKITQFTVKKSVLKDQINQLIKDTVDSYGKMTSYLKEEIGGEKKLLKINEKSAEGDLKGKKLEEFNTYNNYVNKHNSAIQLLKEQQLASQKNEEKLSTELSKKEFLGVSKEQYQQKNGVKDGGYISHFENGKTSSEGTFKDGKYNEQWTFYYENGNTKGRGSYLNGDGTDLSSTGLSRNGRNGQWLLFFENGKLEQECNYLDGKLNGVFKSYYSDGKPSSEGTYKEGKYNDSWSFYYENGNIKGKGNFKMGDGTDLGSTGISRNGRDGNWELYHENGKISQECGFFDGKRKGVFKSYFSNGKLEEESNILNEKYDGKYTSWFENGNLKKEGFFNNGKSFGLFKYYYETGVLSSEENWKDTLRDGIYKSYYENGKLKQDGIYKEGKANGVYKWYHDNGKLKQEGTFINGKSSGLFKNYYPTGVLSSEENWKDELKEGLCKYYYENGSKKQETNYVFGKINGPMKLYYGNGNIDKQFIMKNGKAHGESKHYFESGVLKLSCTYDTLAKEKITGDTKLFDENGLLLEHSYYNLDGTAVDKLKKVSQSNNNNSKNNSSNEQTTFNICDDGGKYINREITLTGFYSRYENDNRQLRDWTYEDLHSDINYGFVKDNDVYYTREIKSNSGCQIILRIPKKLSYDKAIPNIDSGQYITVNGILIKENIIQVIGITR